MRLEQLTYFVELARSRSLHKAADHLFIAHQSLHASIKNLEKEMGTPLFIPSKSGMTLTANGEKFLAVAQNILSQIHELKLDFSLSQLANTTDTELSILITPIFDSIILSDIINVFSKTCPNVGLQIAEREGIDILTQLNQPSPHPMIAFINFKQEHDIGETMHFLPLAKVHYIILVPKALPLEFKTDFSYEKLLSQPIALFESKPKTSPCYKMLAQHGQVDLMLSTNSYNTFRNVLYNGLSIGIVPEYALLNFENNSGKLNHYRIPDENFFSTLGILVKKEDLDCPSIKLVLEIAQHTVQSYHLNKI